MKILLLSQFFSTTKGGGEYVFSLIAKLLAQNGNKVWVITNPIKNESYLQHENIKFIFVPPEIQYRGGIPLGFSDNVKYSLNTILKGISVIKNEKIDLIHSNNFAPALAGSILSSLKGVPHITAVHDVFSLCGKNYWKMWGKQNNVSQINVRLAPFFEKMMIKLKHNIIHTVSEATKDDLIKLGAKKPINVIENSIEINEPQTVKINHLQLIYVGRLVFYKNLEVVIKAISIIKTDYSNIKLLIVGGGPHRETLEKLVKKLDLEKNVNFTGFVSSEEKVKLIASSSALVFPSLCEGFGLVILEAFEQKKPVLVSNIRPLSDIVSDQNSGFVLSPQNENDWVSAIKKIIINPENAKKMGEVGRKELLNRYNVEKMYEQIINMYNNCKKPE